MSVKLTRAAMTATEKYLFDLQGFLVVKGVLSPAEVAAANAAIDTRAAAGGFCERTGAVLRNTKATSGAMMTGDGTTGRLDMGGMLGWPGADSAVFRSVLAHPRLVPYFETLLGQGYRMDHMPLLIASEKGCDGFSLHGGTVDEAGNYNPGLAYTYSHGRMHNPLLACSVQLCDHGAGDGGFVCVPGSHKANFPTPPELMEGRDTMGCLVQPVTEAGDVVLFSEGTVHGAAAWTAEHQRRVSDRVVCVCVCVCACEDGGGGWGGGGSGEDAMHVSTAGTALQRSPLPPHPYPYSF